MKHLLFFLLLPLFASGQPDSIFSVEEYVEMFTKRGFNTAPSYQLDGCDCLGCKERKTSIDLESISERMSIKGKDGVIAEEIDGVIRITRKETDAVFWRRKYADLLRHCLDVIERE